MGRDDGDAAAALIVGVRGPPERPAPVLWSAVHGLATLAVDGPLAHDEANDAIEDLLDVQLAGIRG